MRSWHIRHRPHGIPFLGNQQLQVSFRIWSYLSFWATDSISFLVVNASGKRSPDRGESGFLSIWFLESVGSGTRFSHRYLPHWSVDWWLIPTDPMEIGFLKSLAHSAINRYWFTVLLKRSILSNFLLNSESWGSWWTSMVGNKSSRVWGKVFLISAIIFCRARSSSFLFRRK